jgi:hypothetical protein
MENSSGTSYIRTTRLYVCVHICVQARTRLYVCVHICVHASTRLYVCVHICVQACTRLYVRVHICVHARTRLYVCVHICVHARTRKYWLANSQNSQLLLKVQCWKNLQIHKILDSLILVTGLLHSDRLIEMIKLIRTSCAFRYERENKPEFFKSLDMTYSSLTSDLYHAWIHASDVV